MNGNITTIKTTKEISDKLLIIAKLNNTTKEELTKSILSKGLKPYWDNIKKDRFN